MSSRYFIRQLSCLFLLSLQSVLPPSAAGQDSIAPFPAHAYMVRYHGGSSGESEVRPLVDRAGNLLICGNTSSIDFPQQPPGKNFMKNNQSVFAAKFDRDGGAMLYSRRFGSRLTMLDAAIGANDEVVLLVDTYYDTSFDSLLTADATDSTKSRGGLIILDCKGEILYASYLPLGGVASVFELEIVETGEIWLLGMIYEATPFTTPDAPCRTPQGNQDAYLMRLSATDRRIEFATIVGGPGRDMLGELAVGPSGVAIAGYNQNGGYPMVNAVQDSLKGYTDLVITRLSPDGRAILFSSYYGGSLSESINKLGPAGDLLQLDSEGRMYLLAVSGSSDFPLTDSTLLAPMSYSNVVLCVFSPQHAVERAIRLGGTDEIRISDMEIDDCGHVIFTGLNDGQNFTPRNALWDVGRGFLSVVDTRQVSLRLNSRVPGHLYDWGQLCLDGSSLFLTGIGDSTGIPPTAGLPGPMPPRNNSDAFVAAISMLSLCPRPAIGDSSMRTLALDLLAPDTLRIDIPRQLVKPATFPLDLRLHNKATDHGTGALRLGVTLQGGIAFENGAESEQSNLAPLSAGGEVRQDWTVRTNFDRIHPREDLYIVAVASTEEPCPVGASRVKHIRVLYTDFTYADLRCEVEPMRSFEANAEGTMLEPDTVALRVRVINRSDNEAPLQALRLHFSTDSGLQPFGPAAMERPIAPIAPRDTAEIFWTLRADTRQYNRRVSVAVALVDTFGYEMRHGAAELFIPGAPGTRCHLQAPSSLVLKGDGVTAYDTLLARLFAENESDTVRFYSDLMLDLSAAPHLRVAEADTLERGAFYVRERFRRVFDWRLVASADVTAPSDELLRAVYVTDSDGRMHECTRSVRLLPQRLRLDCALIAPDTLHPGPAPALFDTVRITAVFTNSGDLRQELAAATMLPPDGVTSIEALRLPLASLAPGESDSVTWQLLLPLAARPEVYAYTVLALRADDGEAARCTRALRVEAAPGRYAAYCVTAGHDSVWRDPYYGRLIPNPLQLQYTLGNNGALDLPACDVAIVLPAPLRLAAGEVGVRRVPVLRPGERWSVEWLLDVDDASAIPGPWTVRWEVRCGDSLLDLSCVREIGVAEQAPAGIVLTPWLLRFEGERGEELPSPREVQTWTGGGTEPPWQFAALPPWMDATPAGGRGHVRLAVAPNTTMLVPGRHADSLVIAPAPLQPGTIHIRYVLEGVLGAEEATMPIALEMGAVHPNPVPAGSMLQVEITAPSAHMVMVTVHDLLGRERRRAFAATGAPGAALLRLPASGLEAGMYLLSVSDGTQRRTRIFAVER